MLLFPLPRVAVGYSQTELCVAHPRARPGVESRKWGLLRSWTPKNSLTLTLQKSSEDGKYRHPTPVKIVLRNGIVVTGDNPSCKDDWNLIVACKKNDKTAWILIFKHGILKVEPANPQPKNQKQKQKGTSADFTSHFTPEQLAEINASKSDVQTLFTDRKSLTKAEAVKRLDLDTKVIGRVLFVLSSEGFLSMSEPKPTAENPDPKVIFTRR